MIAHAIAMEGIGFPFLSRACYWFIAAGEDQALQFIELADVGADVAHVVSQVSVLRYVYNIYVHLPIHMYCGRSPQY